jgi:hypothetical protein
MGLSNSCIAPFTWEAEEHVRKKLFTSWQTGSRERETDREIERQRDRDRQKGTNDDIPLRTCPH